VVGSPRNGEKRKRRHLDCKKSSHRDKYRTDDMTMMRNKGKVKKGKKNGGRDSETSEKRWGKTEFKAGPSARYFGTKKQQGRQKKGKGGTFLVTGH